MIPNFLDHPADFFLCGNLDQTDCGEVDVCFTKTMTAHNVRQNHKNRVQKQEMSQASLIHFLFYGIMS